MSAQTTNNPPSAAPAAKNLSKNVIFGTVAVIVILALVALYAHNHNSNNSTNKITSNKKSVAVTGIGNSATTAATGNALAIKELGVQLPVPDSLQGVKYSVTAPPAGYEGAPTIVNLQLDSYSELVNKCMGTTSSKPQAFATLTKSPGTGPKAASTLKQFTNFYINNLGPSFSAGTACKDTTVQQQLNDLTTSLTSDLQSAFSSASTL